MSTLNNMKKIQRDNSIGISRIIVLTVCLLFFFYYANATTYYSIASGNWNVATTWSTVGYGGTASSSVPTLATDIINIGDGKTVTIASGTTVSSASITIDATGTLTNQSTSAITTTSWTCNGTYNHATSAVTLPLGTSSTTWAANSNLNITGSYTVATVFLNFENQTFGNFTFNPATMSNTVSLVGAAGTTTVQGNFTITQTGTSTLYMRIYGQQFANTLNINGNFTQSAGIYDLHNGGPTATMQIINLKGNFTLSGTSVLTQTTTQSGSTVGFNFMGTGVQTVSIAPTASITSQATTPTCAIQFNVASGSTIDMGTSMLTGTNNTSFILSPGATIITANADGISASGATGSIQVAGTRNYSTSANYTYNGSLAQITGTGLPSSVNNLTISNNAGVTFSAAETITGTLAMGSSSVANLNALAIATNAFTVGGVSKANGTYGGTGSGASTILSPTFTANSGTLNVSCIFDTWTGATSTDWNTDSNWSCGIPSSATNVTINSGGNQPIIGASASCANLTLNTAATLTISGSNTLTVSGNWTSSGTFTPNSGTVIFNNAAQTISGATTFNNVTIGGSGVKTITTGNFTVNAILSMEGTATLSAIPTYGTAATLQYNTSTARTAGVEWISPFVATGGVLINSTGAISLNAAKVFNASVPLSINTGATLTPGIYLLTLAGDLNNDGTITSGTFGVTITGTAATQNIDGFTTSGTVSMTKTAGTATLTGNVNGGAFTLNGIGGTINLGTNLTHTFTGTFTKTNGTINLNSSTLNINGATSGTGGTWTQGTSTVVYGGTAQTVFGVNYYNLTLSGSGTKTFAAATTNNNIYINTGVVANLGTGLTHSANALYFAGALQNPGTWGGTTSSATNINTTYFANSTGIISIANIWTGTTNTDWNTATNWSEGIVPTTAWDVIIPAVTNQPIIATTAYCNNITINTGASLTISGSNILNVNAKWANSGTFTANSSTVYFNGAAQTITGSTTFNNVTVGGSAVKTITTANFIVNGILSLEGTATISAAPTYGSAATLQYNTSSAKTAGPEWISPFVASGGIIITNTGAITLNSAEILNATAPLTLNSGATLAMSTFALTLNGNFINNGGTTSGSGGVVITGTATQSIGSFTNTGTVSMTKTAGTATFTGNINGGPLTINGSGGTLNLGSGLNHTFTGNITLTAGTLNGGSSILNVNYTSTTAWTGTGSYFTAGTSTVVFGGGNQTLTTPSTFYNLTFGGSGLKTLTGTPTIQNILSMEGSATVSKAPTYNTGTNATLQYNSATPRTLTATNSYEWISPFTATGGIIITNTGAITLNVAKVFNAGVPLNINTGATLATANYQLTFGGDFINNGTFTAGSSPIVISGTATTQNIAGFTTTGAVSMTKTAGTATLLGNVNAAALTINGSGGTLNLGTALTHTFTGDIALTTGTLNGGSSTLQANSSTTTAWTGTGSNFTAGTSTVSFGGIAQTINTATTFYNLTLSGTGTKTFAAATTTSGNFSFRSGVLANLGTYTHSTAYLYEAGLNKLTGSYGSTASPATYKDATYFGTSATGILNVTSSTGCSGGNNTWTGAVSTDWNTAGNWCGGIPTSASNVIIPSGGNQPIISSSAICAGININSGATLTISGTNSLVVYGNWQNDGTFTANNSTVSFSSLAPQSILGANITTFNNLTISNGGTVTLTTTPVVNGILSMEGAPLATAPTYGSSATLQYNSSTAQTVGPEWISPFVATGGVVIKNVGVITLNGAKQLGNNTSVPLNINAGATLATANYGLIFHGDFINSGTFTAGSSLITIDGTVSAQNIGKFTTTGGVICSKSSGTATLTGNINAASLTNSTSGGTLNLGVGLTHMITGAWTRTNGTVNGGSSTLNIGGNVTNTAGTFTAGTSTLNYNGTDQNTASVNYYNLILSGSGTKTLQTATSSIGNNFTLSGTASTTIASNLAVSGNLTVGSGTTLATQTNYTLGISGSTSITGTYTDGSTGAKTFTGDITLNTGAIWNETAISAYSIAGNFTNNATTFTSNSGVHTFTGTSKILSGATTISIPSATFSGTYSNNGTLTVNTTLAGSGTLTQGIGSTLNIGGTTTISNLLAGTNSNTVNYSGVSQSILPITYYHLTLSGSGTETLTGISTINGNFTTGGTVSVNAAAALTIAGNVNIGSTSGFVAGSYTHNVGGNWTKNGAFTSTGSTINFNGTSAQIISANVANFNNIIFSGSGSITAAGPLGIGGDLTINSGSTFIAGNYIHSLKGNWTNNGVFTANSSTISLVSGSNQNITGAVSTTFNSLAMNGTGGATLGITTNIAGTLSLNLSKITIGDYNLIITPTGTVSGGSTTSYIKTSANGRLKQQIVGQATISYPVGNSAYNPIIITNNGTNSTDNYSIRVGEGAITNANSTKTINRQWYIMKDIVASTNLTVAATYNSGEEGTGFLNNSSPVIGYFNGSAWAYQPINSGSNTTTFTASGSAPDMSNPNGYLALGSGDAFNASKLSISVLPPTPYRGQNSSIATIQALNSNNVSTYINASTTFDLTSNKPFQRAGGLTGFTLAANTYQTIVNNIQFNVSTWNDSNKSFDLSATVTATRTSGESLTAGVTPNFAIKEGSIYQPLTSGNWSSVQWQKSTDGGTSWANTTLPANNVFAEADLIQIPVGINLTADVISSFYSLLVFGTMNINSSGTLTINHTTNNLSDYDLEVYGTLENSGGSLINSNLSYVAVEFIGGTYWHNMNGGSIPTATWNSLNGTPSSCYVTGITSTALSGLNQSFQNFTWNNSSQAVIQYINGDMNVSGSLILTNGVLSTDVNHVIEAANGSISRTNGYINGNLRLYVPNTTAPTIFFPIGDTNYYAPISIAFVGNVSGSGYFDASTTAAKPAYESGLSQTKYINRKWTINNYGVGGFSSFTPTFTFDNHDEIGSPTLSNLVVRKLSGNTWSVLSTSQSGNSVSCSGQTTFSDFYVGESDCSSTNAIWLGSTSSDWNTGSNWCSGSVPTATTNVSIPSSPTNQPIINSSATCANLTILSGANLTLSGTNTLDVKTNWVNNGTFTANTGTVSFSGSSAQTISGTSTFFNLTINNSAGVTSLNNLTVNGLLTLTSSNPDATHGTLDMGSDTLSMLSASASISGAGDVSGIVRRTHTFTPNTQYSFGSQYTTLSFLGTGTQPSEITCNISLGSTLPDKPNAILRHYSFAQTGTAGTDKVTVNLRYLTSELNGNTESNMVLWDHHFTGNIEEHGKTNNSTVNHWVGLSGLAITYIAASSTKYWGLSNYTAIKNTWVGGADTNWSNDANWTAGHAPYSTDDVLIPDVSTGTKRYPTLSTDVEIHTLEIAANALVSANSYTLTINGYSGAWQNNGTFNPGTGTVSLTHGIITDIVSISGNGVNQFNNINIAANTFIKPGTGVYLQISGMINGDITSIADLSSFGNTVEYNGTDQYIVNPLTSGFNFSGYYNLTISGSGTKTLIDNLTISGNFVNNGLLDTGSGTVSFVGIAPQTISGTTASIFNKVTISNPYGVTSSTDLTVNGVLQLTDNPSTTKGALDMGSHTINYGDLATNTGVGDVTGNNSRNGMVASKLYTFGNPYSSIVFAPNVGTIPSNITMNVSLGAAPGWKTSAVKRIYSLSQTGNSGTKATIRMHYLDTELNGNTEELLIPWVYLNSITYPGTTRSGFDLVNDFITLSNVNFTFTSGTQFTLANTIVTSCTWTGAVSTDWNDATNWFNAILPTPTSNVIIPDATTVPYTPSLATDTISTIYIQKAGVLNSVSDAQLTLKGNAGTWNNDGTFNPNTSNVIFANGTDATVSGTTNFYNITISSGTRLANELGSVIGIAGSVTNNGTWSTVSQGVSTVNYNGGSQTIVIPDGSTNRYYNLILSGTGTKTMPSHALDVVGDFTISGTASATMSGLMNFDGNVTLGSGSSFTAGSFTHNVIGNWTNNGATLDNSGSTFNFNGVGTQTIGGTATNTFNNLNINDTTNVYFSSNLALTGTLTIPHSGTLVHLGANLTNDGTINIGSATVIFDGTTAQIINGSSITTFNNLTISNLTGVTASTDQNVNGVLNLTTNPDATHGALDMGSNTLNMGVSATNTGIGDVIGIVKRQHAFTGGVVYTFGNPYTSIDFLNVSGSAKPAWISLKTTIGAAPSWNSSAIKRIYSFAQEASGTDRTITSLHYLDSELNGITDETKLVYWDAYTSPDYSNKYPRSHTNFSMDNNWIGLTGMAINFMAPSTSLDYKQWSLGYSNVSKITWTGNGSPTYSGDWNLPGNWNGGVPTANDDVVIPALADLPDDTHGLPTRNLLSSPAVCKSLEIKSGSTLTVDNYNITVYGSTGAWLNNGTFVPGTGSVIFANGSTSNTVTIAGTTNFNNLTVNDNTQIQPATGSVIRIAGNISQGSGSILDFNSTNNTVEFNGTSDQTVTTPHAGYYNLTLSGNVTKTLPAIPLTTVGDLTINGTSTVVNAANTMSIGNALSVANGTVLDMKTYKLNSVSSTSGTGTVKTQNTSSLPIPSAKTWTGTLIYNATEAQTAVAGTFNNLTCDNSAELDLNDSIIVSGTLLINSSREMDIAAGAKMVANQIINNAGTSGLYVLANSTGANGTLIFNNPGNSPVSATVGMYSKAAASVVNGNSFSQYKWQFFGIPVQSVATNPTFADYVNGVNNGSYIRKHEESGTLDLGNYWVSQGSNAVLIPFAGYEVTQKYEKTIYFEGQLVNSDYSATLSYTTGAAYKGQHILGNPYTAAIDIKKLNFGSEMDSCVYLYNTGSWSEWNSNINSGSGENPGQYAVAPQKVAGSAGIPGQIPSMQGFLVAAKSSSQNATIGIPYSSVIRNTTKQRVRSVNSITTDRIYTRIDINGTRFSDKMWIFTDPTCTRGYDNGWDGYKFLGSSLAPQLWAMESSGDYQVDAVSDINNTNLGFITGEDTNYKLTFTHENLNLQYPALYLVDLLDPNNPVFTDITQSGSTYSFSAVQSSTPVSRFKIVTSPGIATGISNTENKSLNIFTNQDGKVFILNPADLTGNVVIYDMAGKALQSAKVNAGGLTTIPTSFVPGCYILSVAIGNEKVNRKVIIR